MGDDAECIVEAPCIEGRAHRLWADAGAATRQAEHLPVAQRGKHRSRRLRRQRAQLIPGNQILGFQ